MKDKNNNKEKICSYNHQLVERFERCPKCGEKMNSNHCSDAWFEQAERNGNRRDWENKTGKYSDFSGGWFEGAFD